MAVEWNERRNLVIVRAGDRSIHEGWLNAAGEARGWDLIVSYFGRDPDRYRGGDWLRIDHSGLKFQALHELITSHQELIARYEYIWFPDEDLEFTCSDANRFFERCREWNLGLAQPALTADSYFSHMITLHSWCFQMRVTNFVEIMAPCMQREVLWKLLPTFQLNQSGWGLDCIWPALLEEMRLPVAIVDDVQVCHTRPVGGGDYYKVLAQGGKIAWHEWEDLLAQQGLTFPILWNRRGVLRTGHAVSGLWTLWSLWVAGLLRLIVTCRKPWAERGRVLWSNIYHQYQGYRLGQVCWPAKKPARRESGSAPAAGRGSGRV